MGCDLNGQDLSSNYQTVTVSKTICAVSFVTAQEVRRTGSSEEGNLTLMSFMCPTYAFSLEGEKVP